MRMRLPLPALAVPLLVAVLLSMTVMYSSSQQRGQSSCADGEPGCEGSAASSAASSLGYCCAALTGMCSASDVGCGGGTIYPDFGSCDAACQPPASSAGASSAAPASSVAPPSSVAPASSAASSGCVGTTAYCCNAVAGSCGSYNTCGSPPSGCTPFSGTLAQCNLNCDITQPASSAAPVPASSAAPPPSLPYCNQSAGSPDRISVVVRSGDKDFFGTTATPPTLVAEPYDSYNDFTPSPWDPEGQDRPVVAGEDTARLLFRLNGVLPSDAIIEGAGLGIYTADIDDDPGTAGYLREVDDYVVLNGTTVYDAFDDTFQSFALRNDGEDESGYASLEPVRIDGNVAQGFLNGNGEITGYVGGASRFLAGNPTSQQEVFAVDWAELSITYFRGCTYRTACSDEIDNDGDGGIDAGDPGCMTGGVYNPSDNDEGSDFTPQCSNGQDDADAEDDLADFCDPGCGRDLLSETDNEEIDPFGTSSSSTRPECDLPSSASSVSSAARGSNGSAASLWTPCPDGLLCSASLVNGVCLYDDIVDACSVTGDSCGYHACRGSCYSGMCRSSASSRSAVAGGVCGDGRRGGTEECDDGNTAGGDCCSSTCSIENGCYCRQDPGQLPIAPPSGPRSGPPSSSGGASSPLAGTAEPQQCQNPESSTECPVLPGTCEYVNSLWSGGTPVRCGTEISCGGRKADGRHACVADIAQARGIHFTPDSRYVIYGDSLGNPMIHRLSNGQHYSAEYISAFAPAADQQMLELYSWAGDEGLSIRHNRQGQSLTMAALQQQLPEYIIVSGTSFALGDSGTIAFLADAGNGQTGLYYRPVEGEVVDTGVRADDPYTITGIHIGDATRPVIGYSRRSSTNGASLAYVWRNGISSLLSLQHTFFTCTVASHITDMLPDGRMVVATLPTATESQSDQYYYDLVLFHPDTGQSQLLRSYQSPTFSYGSTMTGIISDDARLLAYIVNSGGGQGILKVQAIGTADETVISNELCHQSLL